MTLLLQIAAIWFKRINGEIQYLLLKRISNLGEFWQPDTGGLEEGETKIEALKREIKEETGIKNLASMIEGVTISNWQLLFMRKNTCMV